MSIETTSPRQALQAVKSYVLAAVSASYSSNVTTSDHIKFDTINASAGSDISLDTATSYTNSANVASIGRFRLKAGKTYRLSASISMEGSTSALAGYRWYDATNSAYFAGSLGYSTGPLASTSAGRQPVAQAIITPSTDIYAELRITDTTDLTNIYVNATSSSPWGLIESVEQVIPVRKSAAGVAYIKDVKANSTAAQTVPATTWTTRELTTLTTTSSSDTWISLSSNQFTLQPGQYDFRAEIPNYRTNYYRSRLRNITSSTTEIVGSAGRSENTADATQ